MKLGWRSELPHVVLLAGMFALALHAWSWAPDRIPVHWNLTGHVDRYGGKFEGLLALLLTALGMYVLLVFLPHLQKLPAGATDGVGRTILALFAVDIIDVKSTPEAVVRPHGMMTVIDFGRTFVSQVHVAF